MDQDEAAKPRRRSGAFGPAGRGSAQS